MEGYKIFIIEDDGIIAGSVKSIWKVPFYNGFFLWQSPLI